MHYSRVGPALSVSTFLLGAMISCSSSPTASTPPAPATVFTVTGLPASLAAGTASNISVTAKSASGSIASEYMGTVHFTSTDPAAQLPANYTFTSGDGGHHSFTVTLRTAGSETVTATDASTSSITGNATADVSPGAVAALALAFPASVTSASPVNGTVRATDASGNTIAGYVGTIHFTSTDTAATLPSDFTYAAADSGRHAFAVTFRTAGGLSFFATDVAASSITGHQVIGVVPGAASHFQVGIPDTATTSTAVTGTLTALDASGNTATGYVGSVHFTLSDGAAQLPADYLFVAADLGHHAVSATFHTKGSQTAIATDQANPLITGSRSVLVVPPMGPVFVVNEIANSVTGYSAGARGNATPTVTIVGSNTKLNQPFALAFDPSGKLFVANRGTDTVMTFAAGASGNVTPVSTIAGPSTELNTASGLAFDSAGRLYVANSAISAVTAYAAGASGDASPTNFIIGPNTSLNAPGALLFDKAGELFVANFLGNTITIYYPAADANAVPELTFSGFSGPDGLAMDSTGMLYVANANSNSISLINYFVAGGGPPTSPIQGPNTGLSYPTSLCLDSTGRLYVANSGSNTITIYAAGAEGNVSPIATISGANTGLNGPIAIAVH